MILIKFSFIIFSISHRKFFVKEENISKNEGEKLPYEQCH